jgi:hypothetical protein
MRTSILVLLLSVSVAEPAQLLSVQKIWDAAPHNAFTDLIRYQDQWLCAFREGNGHVSPDGAIRILSSPDATHWQSWSQVTLKNRDLRDPKLSITPSGELMLLAAGARRPADSAAAKDPVTHQTYSWVRGKDDRWRGANEIGDRNAWLWRVTWHKGFPYSVGYDTGGEKFVRLYKGLNFRQFDVLVPTLFSEGYPNETGLIFRQDDTALCLLRRDGSGTNSTGLLGRARPPYTDWTWQDLGVKIGGPQLIELPDKRLIAGVRLYDGKVRTSIVEIDPATPKLSELLALPSGGDTSYPGLVWHEGKLFVSYYSSHEGKTAIYLAQVKLD